MISYCVMEFSRARALRIPQPATPYEELRKSTRRQAPLPPLDLKLRTRKKFACVANTAYWRRCWQAPRTKCGNFLNGKLPPYVPISGTPRLGRGPRARCEGPEGRRDSCRNASLSTPRIVALFARRPANRRPSVHELGWATRLLLHGIAILLHCSWNARWARSYSPPYGGDSGAGLGSTSLHSDATREGGILRLLRARHSQTCTDYLRGRCRRLASGKGCKTQETPGPVGSALSGSSPAQKPEPPASSESGLGSGSFGHPGP